MTMRAVSMLSEPEITDAEPISTMRPVPRPALRPSILPLPVTLLLTDLMLGACYSDGTFCEREQGALRALLSRLLQVNELPPEIDDRINQFDPKAFNPQEAARKFVQATNAGNRPLLEVICEICTADARLELDENEYMLSLVVALEMAKEEYQGLAQKSGLAGKWHLAKRLEDLALGGVALSALAVPMLIIGLLVKLTSPGPALFCQKRYGEGGREFLMYKFRSMTTMENGATVTQAKKGDARVTRLGAFLRRTSLDELPQLLNVLRGDMSLVGPRPHATAHNEMYRQLIVRYMLRHQVKPGITGFAQVNGWRGETDTLEKMVKRVEHDLAYIENWSLWLDVKCMFLTVFGRKVRQNAY
jgi:putative colanic acid biosynthesis UDP-glucose lipid carrier transferase